MKITTDAPGAHDLYAVGIGERSKFTPAGNPTVDAAQAR